MLRGLRLCSLCALLLSAATAVDYYAATGHGTTFCGEGSGCDAVRHSGLGESIGVALPALGLGGFLLILLSSLARGRRLQLLSLSAAVTGGVAGAILLALQALVVGTFCWLCVGVDLSAMAAGALAVPLLRRPTRLETGRLERGVWTAAAVLALGGPFAWAASDDGELPNYIASLGKRGKIDVVEISDFECPYCRAMHPYLDAVLREAGEQVHFVRKTYPLPNHPHARDAARGYVCAEAQGRGEAMADALFTRQDLSRAAIEGAARELGLDMDRFLACVDNPATDRAIDRDMARIREAGFEGLPTVWIGSQAIVGFDRSAGAAPYRQALQDALAGQETTAPWVPWAVTLLLAMLGFGLGAALPLRHNDAA